MKSKWDAIRGHAGFYVTMAVCLAVVGVSSWFFLFDQAEKPEVDGDTPPVSGTVLLPAQEPDLPVETPPVEVLPEVERVEETVQTTSMPEVEIDETPLVPEAPRLIVTPLKGEIIAAFSVDELQYDVTMDDWRIHDGIDISAKPGTTVLAACSGTVLSVEEDALLGTKVVLSHPGNYQTTYANLQSAPPVKAGDEVSAGQIIGAVGMTAAAESAQSPHLHFSVCHDGDTVDPNEFLEK